jgi:hypothetical protein
MRKALLITLITLLFLSCGKSSTNSGPNIISVPGGIVVFVDEKMKFYSPENTGEWVERVEYEITLPQGYKSVFGYWNGLGVVVGDKLKHYRTNSTGKWVEGSEYTLPSGYKKVIPYSRGLGVVIDDKLRYFYNPNGPVPLGEQTNYAFTLPKGYKDIIALSSMIGVVVGDRLKIYNRDVAWVEDSEFIFFFVYKKIIEISPGFGVIVGDKMKVYLKDSDNKWVEKSDYEFTLP